MWPSGAWQYFSGSTAYKLIALAAAIYGFHAYVDSRVEKIANTREFIERVASRVRPSLIFDANESVMVDAGGLQYIDRVNVRKRKNGWLPIQIIVTPKHYMAQAPLLTCLDPIWFKIKERRGQAVSWVYELDARGHMGGFEPIRFRLEITPK